MSIERRLEQDHFENLKGKTDKAGLPMVPENQVLTCPDFNLNPRQ